MQREERRALAEAAAASRRAFDRASILFDQGLIEFLDVLDAERSLRDREDQLARSDTLLATAAVAI